MLGFPVTDVENWVECDIDNIIDEDVILEISDIPPPEVEFESEQGTSEGQNTIRWVLVLLSVFQTQFYLTN